MKRPFLHPIILFAVLLVAMSAVYLLSLFYLPPQAHIALLVTVFTGLAILEFRSLHLLAATTPVPAFRHKPGRLWLVWLGVIGMALLMGAGLGGLSILIEGGPAVIDYQKQIGSGLMLACIMLLSNYAIHSSAGRPKAIHPEK
jgi:hypothetical protein